MKITVLGGSPKGSVSVTMQYVEFLKTNFPEHQFVIHLPAHEISLIEKNRKRFDAIMDDVGSSALILWAFPLYVFTVCSQYQRFLELVEERGRTDAFKDKYAASLSTSIHFFDHTAHNFIRATSEDFGMRFTSSFSAHMNDLMKPAVRKNIILFLENVISQAASQSPVARAYSEIRWDIKDYVPTNGRTAPPLPKKAVVLTDGMSGNTGRMATKTAEALGAEIVDIQTIDIKGGCMGCLKCGHSNVCAYTGKDGFIGMFNEKVKGSEIVIFAGTMRGRHLSSRWKMFLDRSFFNTHQRVLTGKQIAFLISGPLSQNHDLREILTAYSEWQDANLVEIISDEWVEGLDSKLESLAERLRKYSDQGYQRPATFLGYAGMKVFRDDIYSDLRAVFQGDYRAYRRSHVFDFPTSHPVKNLFIALLTIITGIPAVNRKMMANFKKFMLMPYRHLTRMKLRN